MKLPGIPLRHDQNIRHPTNTNPLPIPKEKKYKSTKNLWAIPDCQQSALVVECGTAQFQ